MSEKHKREDTPNVVDLAEFRRQRIQGRPTLFYISESADWLELLESYRLFDIRHATSVSELAHLFDSSYPDVVFVESWLSWGTPVELIRHLAETYEVPIILSFREGSDPESTRKQIKEAYAAGVSDALQCPLHREELKETLEVLLKLQTQFSLYH
ncbi:MAG: hypothetical protein R3B54_05025 [Bdellovibrionota bacterium]